MLARSSGLVRIPGDLSSVDAAPLLCAGLTTFSALRNAPAKAGDLVAVLGVGGLGHLGIQYARHMGFEVVAIGRGAETAELAKKLGADHYIDNAAVDQVAALQALGGAQLILITAPSSKTVSETFEGLRPNGVSILIGVGQEPIAISGLDPSCSIRALAACISGESLVNFSSNSFAHSLPLSAICSAPYRVI
jgi:alcohol dehydrogenase, propanol-preferring